MAVEIQVRGLKQAAQNLLLIGKVAATETSRKSILESLLVLVRAIKAATYTTGFQKRTGAVKAGFGARVAFGVKGTFLRGWIVQYPQPGVGIRAKARAKDSSKAGVAFYWRFLELGTHGRRTARTPKFLKKGNLFLSPAHKRSAARYAAAASLGDLPPRPWVGPTFKSQAARAIEVFGVTFKNRVQAAVENLPKK
jgi:hypothetical protein